MNKHGIKVRVFGVMALLALLLSALAPALYVIVPDLLTQNVSQADAE